MNGDTSFLNSVNPAGRQALLERFSNATATVLLVNLAVVLIAFVPSLLPKVSAPETASAP